MFRQTIGDPKAFALEWGMSRTLVPLSQLAIGFFAIHVGGNRYGVVADDVAILACSYNEVKERISQRGKHKTVYSSKPASAIAEAVVAAVYATDRKRKPNMSKISIDQLHKEILTNRIIWAPDGDAAFDDGGHVLQFDDGIRVRLIAFRNPRPDEDIKSTLKDVVVEADVFYGVLGKWVSEFDNQRATILKAS